MITIGVFFAAVLTFNTADRDPSWAGASTDPVTIEGYTFTSSALNLWVIPDPFDSDDKPWMYLSPWFGFIGNSPATLTVDRGGGRFDFFSFDATGDQPSPGRVVSSAGHVLDYLTRRDLAITYNVSWMNLEWIQFQYDYAGFGANGFDNLDVVASAVYEPTPLQLILIGLSGLGLFGVTRRLKWQ